MQDNLFEEFQEIFSQNPEETEGLENNDQTKKERVYTFSPFALQDAIGEKNIKLLKKLI